jgi:hypothetical protein
MSKCTEACKWKQVAWSQIYKYEKCESCSKRKITQIREGYQPVLPGWEDVYKEWKENLCKKH